MARFPASLTALGSAVLAGLVPGPEPALGQGYGPYLGHWMIDEAKTEMERAVRDGPPTHRPAR